MRSYGQFCGLARALDHVGQRWTLLIVRELLLGPKRFTDLRHGLPGIATNLLTDRLRQLEADGLVRQRELPPPSSSTVYELTETGRALRPVVQELIRWGGRWMVAGPGDDDVFRGGWLALALEALGAGTALDGERVIHFETGSGATTLSLGTAGVEVAGGGDPELVVRGDPALILGLAAGAVSVATAAEALELDPPGEASVALLSRALVSTDAERAGVVEGPIRWRLNIPASRERVYEALSTDAGRRTFWAETTADRDGHIRFAFPNGVEYEGRVLESRPGELFAVDYFGGVARFELTPDGQGGTDLELTHTGQRGEEWIETHAGWLNVLFPLKARIGHGVDLRTGDPRRSWDHGYVDG